eukprot:2391312-Rhodomonas_salina.3
MIEDWVGCVQIKRTTSLLSSRCFTHYFPRLFPSLHFPFLEFAFPLNVSDRPARSGEEDQLWRESGRLEEGFAFTIEL